MAYHFYQLLWSLVQNGLSQSWCIQLESCLSWDLCSFTNYGYNIIFKWSYFYFVKTIRKNPLKSIWVSINYSCIITKYRTFSLGDIKILVLISCCLPSIQGRSLLLHLLFLNYCIWWGTIVNPLLGYNSPFANHTSVNT